MGNLQKTNHSSTMSSREIAELTNKQHSHVKRDIEKMLAELEIGSSKLGFIYKDNVGREQTEYHLDRNLTDCLLTGYSAKARMAVIERWRDLETGGNDKASLITRLSLLEQLEVIEEKRQEFEEELAMVNYRRQQLLDAADNALPGTRFQVSRQGVQQIPADSSMPLKALPRW